MNNLSESAELPVAPQKDPAAFVRAEVALLAGRLAAMLRQRFAEDTGPVSTAIGFLEIQYRKVYRDRPWQDIAGSVFHRCQQEADHPLAHLSRALPLGEQELQVLLLAGMAEQHEGFADIFRTLHPANKPLPTVGLAAQLLCATELERLQLRQQLTAGALISHGIVQFDSSEPLFTRGFSVTADVWTLLQGVDAHPPDLPVIETRTWSVGLQHWLQAPVVSDAVRVLQDYPDTAAVLFADASEIALHRGLALAAAAGRRALALRLTATPTDAQLNALLIYCTANHYLPVIEFVADGEQRTLDHPFFATYPGPLIFCCQSGRAVKLGTRLCVNIQIEKLSVAATREAWCAAVPELAPQSTELAARYPVEPYRLHKVVDDLRRLRGGAGASLTLRQVSDGFKNSAGAGLPDSVQLLRPTAQWEQLVLPAPQQQQLHDAVQRLFHQGQVLDDWEFLSQRRGSRGVRMLFSGPPGTGKTLSAEVLANALNVDLLLVDLSRVVSKWIGETEKNLAEVFNQAEQVKAVLFFDEADALFGKRTEVSDAHDRYANLETAYLLSRLERYDGMTILATNFRRNIDAAFVRRLDYIIEYKEPAVAEREALWRCHVPAKAPLRGDVCFAELARLFPIVGGQIRNAAVSAAYYAAQQNTAIEMEHFIRAVRREYEKAGKAYREVTTA